MSKVKVLVVDDSAYSRQTIKKMLETDKDIEVVGIASDGIDATAKTIRLTPDLITLDLEMPEMDGFSFLRWVMKDRPMPVIIVSSYSDSKTVFKALEFGAADFIAKPTKRASEEFKNIEKDLLRKVKGLRDFRMDNLSNNLRLLEKENKVWTSSEESSADLDVVAIGASTGGPAALQIILTRLPSDFHAGIVVSQHMPKGFTASLAERLNGISNVRIKEAKDGDEVEKGKVLVCPGGSHMTFRKRGQGVVTTIKEPKGAD
ncbi:MAG: response regulator, partial [Nitrospirota bacterium]|nr:response regulator [Nitrospirota bacterium]